MNSSVHSMDSNHFFTLQQAIDFSVSMEDCLDDFKKHLISLETDRISYPYFIDWLLKRELEGVDCLVNLLAENIRVMMNFIDCGINANLRNSIGENALHKLALKKVDFIPFSDRALDQPSKDLIAMSKFLIQNGADINCQDVITQKTALHKAVNMKNGYLCLVLMIAGADCTIIDFRGETPFDKAMKSEDKEFLRYIKEICHMT
jgi:hypothetical protein